MKTAIIVSKKDPAGLNIKESLSNYDLSKVNAELFTMEKDSIFCENIDKEVKADLFIFATKHQSEKGISSLSTHVPGNWSKAEFGGKDKTLCVAPASYVKEAFIEINKLNNLKDFEGTLEVVHHGPYLNKPCMFIEIGSSLKEWKNKDAANIIAQTIVNILSKKIPKYEIAFAIGGPHYCSSLNKVVLRTNIALGQICPKYQLENLDKEMIKQAIEKTQEKVDFVLLDWKGLGKEKSRIIKMLNELNLGYKKTNQIL